MHSHAALLRLFSAIHHYSEQHLSVVSSILTVRFDRIQALSRLSWKRHDFKFDQRSTSNGSIVPVLLANLSMSTPICFSIVCIESRYSAEFWPLEVPNSAIADRNALPEMISTL